MINVEPSRDLTPPVVNSTLKECGFVDQQFNFGYVSFLGCTAALGGMLFGFDIAIITGAGPFIARTFALNDLGLGWAFSSLLFGCVLGCSIAGRLADHYGRRRLLMLVALLFALTSLATALAPGFTSFICARFLGGIAVGGVSLLSPMYVAEVAPPSVRGRMGTLYQMSIIFGILVSYGINYLLRNAGVNNWRWMFSTGVEPSAMFLILLALAPETPRFLAIKGRMQDAFLVLERIGGASCAQNQLEQITRTLHKGQRDWHALVRPGVRRSHREYWPCCSDPRFRYQYDRRLRSCNFSICWLEDGRGAGLNVSGRSDGISLHSYFFLGYRQIRPQAALLCWLAGNGDFPPRPLDCRPYKPLPWNDRCRIYSDLSGLFRCLHRSRFLDAGSGDFSE
jgi:hypothetical protein